MDFEELGRELNYKLDRYHQDMKTDMGLLKASDEQIKSELKLVRTAIELGCWEARITHLEGKVERLERVG